MEIRQVVPSELDQLLQIAIATYSETFAPFNSPENMTSFLTANYTRAQFEKELNEAGSVCYIAWQQTVPVGYARLRLNDEAKGELGTNTLELHRLYILKNHKGKKIGSGLMAEAIRHATNLQITWLWLGVWERNFAAQAFYASWGFEKFGEHIFQMGNDPQIDWMMRKRLR